METISKLFNGKELTYEESKKLWEHNVSWAKNFYDPEIHDDVEVNGKVVKFLDRVQQFPMSASVRSL